jgi:hypothetical protein
VEQNLHVTNPAAGRKRKYRAGSIKHPTKKAKIQKHAMILACPKQVIDLTLERD